MTRLYGRAPRGQRLVARVPHGHRKTLTLVAALRADGVTAPYVIDGAMDGRAPLGQRLVAKVPHGHWKTLTLVAACVSTA